MNTQCDINYKASNNKRLLIELTLMQMVALGSGISDSSSEVKIPAFPVPKKAKKEIAAPEPVEVTKPTMPQVEEKNILLSRQNLKK